jgi:hemoglobin-like flavoprotein
MELEKEIAIPERPQALVNVDTLAWPRLPRQIFWLADGRRDTRKIAVLLHRPLPLINQVTGELAADGLLLLRHEKKTLVMNAALLKESFDMIAPQKDAFAHSFYERLFLDYPQTRALFARTDMRRQEGSLAATLATVVAGVQRGATLVPILQQLGSKHKRYGAQAEHYPIVGAVLIETFHDYLRARFTAEMEEAWEEAFEIISAHMLEGADTAPIPRVG